MEKIKPFSVKYDDNVSFILKEKSITYKVNTCYLKCYEYLNDKIFDVLGLNPKAVCELAYGYKVNDSGMWPESKNDDYDALARVIKRLAEHPKVLNVLINEKSIKADSSMSGEKSIKIDSPTSDEKSPISFPLKEKDTVDFIFDDCTLNYKCMSTHLKIIDRSLHNDVVFKKLGVDPIDFCAKAYGYIPEAGVWPEISYVLSYGEWINSLKRVIIAIAEHPLVKDVKVNGVSIIGKKNDKSDSKSGLKSFIDSKSPLNLFALKTSEEITLHIKKTKKLKIL